MVNGRQLPLAGGTVPNVEACKAERFPGQYHYVLSIIPSLSTSTPNYLQEEKRELECPLEQN